MSFKKPPQSIKTFEMFQSSRLVPRVRLEGENQIELHFNHNALGASRFLYRSDRDELSISRSDLHQIPLMSMRLVI